MKRFIFALALILALFGASSFPLLAGEHGGKEHGGGEHDGAAHEGGHEMAGGRAAVLRQAAAILKADHPELASELEQIAGEMAEA